MVKIFGIRDSFSSGSSHKNQGHIFALCYLFKAYPAIVFAKIKMKNIASLPM